VAVLGPDVREILHEPDSLFRPIDEKEASRPWHEHRRVTLLVEDDDLLRSILDRAAEKFDLDERRDWSTGGYGTGRFVAFRNDSSPLPLDERLHSWLTLVDEDGLAVWGVSVEYEDITFAQLRRAGKAGAIDGDPTKIYLHVQLVPAGGGVLIQWSVLLQAWRIALDIAETAALLGAGYAYLRHVLRERLDGRRVVERHVEQLIARNGWPSTLEHVLKGEPKVPRDLAGLLGCTTDDAKKILSLYGYVEGPDPATWIYAAGDPTRGVEPSDFAARVLVALRREAQFRFPDGGTDEELSELIKNILSEAAETGRIASLGYEEHIEQVRKWFR